MEVPPWVFWRLVAVRSYGFDIQVPAGADGGGGGSDDEAAAAETETRVIPRYVYESHVGSVTCLAMAGTTLVSGASDESIKVYNLVKQKEVGTLFEQQGTVTCLEFFLDGTAKHLMSGSDDGSIVVWSAATWEPLKVSHCSAPR
jgi:WD40 repeat protein